MKQNLVKKLTTILSAGVITLSPIGFTGCTDTENLVANLAADAKVNIGASVFIVPENSTTDHYISFIGHYSTAIDESGIITFYKNHKDYRITYKVSKEDYFDIAKFDYRIVNLNKTEIAKLEDLINTYDPIEVKELAVEESYLHNEFKEEFRFNEEEYLNNLE